MAEKLAPFSCCVATYAWLHCDLSAGGRRSLWYFEINEAMHLLPLSFVFQATHSSSQGAPDRTAALLLPAVVQYFEKPAAPPPAAGFFILRYIQALNSGVKAECPVPPTLRISKRSWIRFPSGNDQRIVRMRAGQFLCLLPWRPHPNVGL